MAKVFSIRGAAPGNGERPVSHTARIAMPTREIARRRRVPSTRACAAR